MFPLPDDIYTELVPYLGLGDQLKLKCVDKFHQNKINSVLIHEYYDFKNKYLLDKINFLNVCIHGYINLAKFLYKKDEDIDDVFTEVCMHGHIEIAKWLYGLSDSIQNYIETSFIWSCQGGHIEIAKWLYGLHSSNRLLCSFDFLTLTSAFVNACCYDHIEIAKWLYGLSNSMQYSLDYLTLNHAFIDACCCGYIEIAEWLYEIGVDIHFKNDFAFEMACKFGQFGIVKWLYKLGAGDINDPNNICMLVACLGESSKSNREVAKWLYLNNAIFNVKNDVVKIYNYFRCGYSGVFKYLFNLTRVYIEIKIDQYKYLKHFWY